MAPRSAPVHRTLPLAPSAQVAVKCDACRGAEGGPACVRSCPVEAIARVDPSAAMIEVREALAAGPPRTGLPRARPAWPWVVGAITLAGAVSRLPVVSRADHLETGLASGALLLLLAGYGVVKRWVLPRAGTRATARPHFVAHLAFSALAVGVIVAHSGLRLASNVPGALLAAFMVAALMGLGAAVAFAAVPRRLSRVERQARLPEDLAPRAKELDERSFGALTGRSDATKAVYARLLAPYAARLLGGLWLVASGRTLREEEARVQRLVGRALGERATELDGLRDLVRLVVERRAVSAQRLLQGLLRGWAPLHIMAVAITLALLVVHVVLVVAGR